MAGANVPNEVILNDSLRRQNAVLEKLEHWLELAAIATQEGKSTETPRKFRPYTANIQNNLGQPTGVTALAFQLMPRNNARDSFSLQNLGPGDLLFSNTQFDPSSILQQISDPNHPNAILPAPMQVVEIGLLYSGGAVSINSSEALWVSNVGGNCVLSIVETVYDRAGTKRPGGFPIPGLDGALGAGYGTAADVDGNPILQKGLR
jgi:hypothetical protein